MPRSPHIPKLCLHRATGQAVVRLDGRDRYLGRYGTPEAEQAYRRLIAEWLAGGQHLRPRADHALTVTELLAAYTSWAGTYYRHPDGRETSQMDRVRRSLAPVRHLYGDLPAADFGPLALKAVQGEMIRLGWSRRYINSCVGCIKRCFAWGVSEQLLPVSVSAGLRTIQGLRQGRSNAREVPAVEPVDLAIVRATQEHVPPFVRDVIEFQLATACRPGEALGLRSEDLLCTGAVWQARPGRHKTAWRGHERILLLGPRAQAIVLRYLRHACPCCGSVGRAEWLGWTGSHCAACHDRLEEGSPLPVPPEGVLPCYLFSPKLAMEERLLELGQRIRHAHSRMPGERYCATSYNHAIAKGCDRAGVPRWHPHQLRHSAATLLVQEVGWDVARVVLGHRDLNATRLYAADDLAKASAAVARLG